MKLGDVEFGRVWIASGTLGFFGEGYWYHKWLRWLGLDFRGATFVAKTTTLEPRAGNMPLRSDGITPRELKPKCIAVKPFSGIALNAVGLSGPGAEELLDDGRWQERREPFQLSFMPLGDQANQLKEAKGFVTLCKRNDLVRSFRAPIALQVNLSCPNVDHGSTEADEALDTGLLVLSTLAELDIPLIPKIDVTWPVTHAVALCAHKACSALCLSNTIKFGRLPDKIDWKRHFGTDDPAKSPLAQFGGGGLSGRPLLPLVVNYLRTFRQQAPYVLVNAGGGILGPGDARDIINAGADSISLGSMAFLRPWRVRETVRAVLTDPSLHLIEHVAQGEHHDRVPRAV